MNFNSFTVSEKKPLYATQQAVFCETLLTAGAALGLPEWLCMPVIITGVQWTHTQSWSCVEVILKWWANGCDASSQALTPFLFRSGRMSYERVLGWRNSKWRRLCPSLRWLTLAPPSPRWSFACRLSWPLNHSTCSGACYCPAHAKYKRGWNAAVRLPKRMKPYRFLQDSRLVFSTASCLGC